MMIGERYRCKICGKVFDEKTGTEVAIPTDICDPDDEYINDFPDVDWSICDECLNEEDSDTVFI